MRVLTRIAVVVAVATGLPLLSPTPAGAVTALTVTPDSGLLEPELVSVTGTGFAPNASVGWCQAVIIGTPTLDDCVVDIRLGNADASGTVTGQYMTHRLVSNSSGEIDCASPTAGCVIGMSDISDITGTAALAPISFPTPPPPPAIRGSIEVVEAAPHLPGDVVTVEGSGFRPGASIVALQCPAGPTELRDCEGPGQPVIQEDQLARTTADGSGAFTVNLELDGIVPRTGVNCQEPSNPCVIAAAERIDIPGTIVSSDPLEFEPVVQADAIIKRQTDGFLFGNDLYTSVHGFVQSQVKQRVIPAGSRFTYAVLVQNDGPVTRDLVVHGATEGDDQDLPVQYFTSYFDITSSMTGAGFTFRDVPVGGTRLIAARFTAAPGVETAQSAFVFVRPATQQTSGSDQLVFLVSSNLS